eukprot:scaffold43433_cov74-Cyclotella_meneghiniana.AAC.9
MALCIGYGIAFAPSPNTISNASQKERSLQCNKKYSRAEFTSKSLTSSLAILLPSLIQINTANAFDGGVGGLGKTRPVTGVVFRDPEAATGTSSSGELLAPDGTPVLLSFSAPWPLLKSAAGIEARDIAGGFESAFVQVAEMQKGITTLDQVVGNGLFMLITTTTATRFKKLDDTLRSVADSFSAIPAPKSSLRK